jgi:serine/threonine protein kinase
VVLGSPPYMSPEQFTIQDVDARTDIYSLGVVCYQALTGQMPFEAQEMLHWATLHMTENPMPFETTDVGMLVPAPMRRAVLRALAKEAELRPPSMRDFYAEFTVHERKSLPAGRASMVPLRDSHLGDFSPPMPLDERTEDRASRRAKTLVDETSHIPHGDASTPIPLLPRPGRIPAELGAQTTRGAHESDFGDEPATLLQPPGGFRPAPRRGDPFGPVGVTVPELVPPTVRDPSLMGPPPGEGIRWWIPAVLALVVGVGSASAYMVYRGAKGESRNEDDPRPVPTSVDAPPTPVDSSPSPWPEVAAPPRPSNAPPPPPGEEHSPCQTAMVAALSSKCDLARRALPRCPEKSQHRASAVRAVEALCGP